jgi:hypothetical protein
VFIAGFNDPILLVITGAVLNAISMFVHIGLTRMLNKTYLHKSLQPSFLRRAILNLSWLVFGVLSVWAIVDALTKYFID